MEQDPVDFGSLARRPSAFLPIAISFAALALLLGHIGSDLMQAGHVIREADEGTDAHVWQLLMVGQIPLMIFFAAKWLRQTPRQAMMVIALQARAFLANLAALFISGLA
ncbi:MAG TPA: hypothetical protein VHX60_04835 [Acidobacteriaceae bacterium]|jgi:hypothetical protein|nr:hypothetical protein [Acidobacteriaceae bacterium]